MVLHPYAHPIVLSRAWCLFELYVAITSQSQVQMCFSPSDESGFFDALRAGRFDAKAVCGTIDATKATASVAEDKAMITDRIEAEVGVKR